MANEVAKYHNDLNTVIMRRWTSEEMNFFFAIIAKAREKGCVLLEFETDELKELTRFSNKHKQRWEDTMRNAVSKIAQLTYYEDTTEIFEVMTLFRKLKVNKLEQRIEVQVSEEFEYILNQIQVQFTTWELEEFTRLTSTYAKTMYRLLKQWRTLGKKEFSKSELFQILDVPKSYRISDINKVVLSPIREQLSPYFLGLKIVPIKAKTRGNPVTGYSFSWQAEKAKEWVDFDKLKKTPKKPIRKEVIPEDIQEAEREALEKGKKQQADYFQQAMELRDCSFEEQSTFFSEARNIDTYRMPEGTQFLNTLATLMLFDSDKYWSELLSTDSADTGGENGR